MRSFLILFPLCLAGCASMAQMEEQARHQACNREYGYEKGTNDAMEGKNMDSSFAAICDPSTQPHVKRAYREGFEAERNRSALEADADGVRIKIPGMDIHMGDKGKKSWVCEISAFGKTFSGFGPTRGQAAHDARKQCEQQYNGIHCNDPDCREDR